MKIEYNGEYPNLCNGNLFVTAGGPRPLALTAINQGATTMCHVNTTKDFDCFNLDCQSLRMNQDFNPRAADYCDAATEFVCISKVLSPGMCSRARMSQGDFLRYRYRAEEAS